MGYSACQSASDGPVAQGCVGAGAGAKVGSLMGTGFATKSGIGSASTDRLIFASDQSSNLSDFSFTGFSGAQEIGLGSGFYEIVPVMAAPEPSTYLGGVIALVALGYHERRLLLRFLFNKNRTQERPDPVNSG